MAKRLPVSISVQISRVVVLTARIAVLLTMLAIIWVAALLATAMLWVPMLAITLSKSRANLRSLGIDRMLVRGHTDAVGAREYNLALSKRPADAVARVLGEGEYPVEGIDTKGMGSAVPVSENATVDGCAKNRRMVIIVQVPTASAWALLRSCIAPPD